MSNHTRMNRKAPWTLVVVVEDENFMVVDSGKKALEFQICLFVVVVCELRKIMSSFLFYWNTLHLTHPVSRNGVPLLFGQDKDEIDDSIISLSSPFLCDLFFPPSPVVSRNGWRFASPGMHTSGCPS